MFLSVEHVEAFRNNQLKRVTHQRTRKTSLPNDRTPLIFLLCWHLTSKSELDFDGIGEVVDGKIILRVCFTLRWDIGATSQAKRPPRMCKFDASSGLLHSKGFLVWYMSYS